MEPRTKSLIQISFVLDLLELFHRFGDHIAHQLHFDDGYKDILRMAEVCGSVVKPQKPGIHPGYWNVSFIPIAGVGSHLRFLLSAQRHDEIRDVAGLRLASNLLFQCLRVTSRIFRQEQ
jgi:hypothetical protein